MTWSLFEAGKSFPSLSDQWAGLNGALFEGHPLLDARFVGPLVKHFSGPSTQLALLGEIESPRAMLLVEPARIGLWRTFLPSQSQIAPVLLHQRDARHLSDLVRRLPGRALALDMLAQDPLYSGVLGKQAGGLPSNLTETHVHARTMSVQLEGSFEQYWASRSRNLIKNVKRYGHRLKFEGMQVELEVATSPEEVAARVDDYGRLESAGWKRATNTAVHPDNVQGRFYAEVMHGFALTGDARVYSLLHDGRVIASRLAIRSPAMIVILKTTYDEGFGRYAVGRLHLRAVLRELFARDSGSVVEFYTNATDAQVAWSTGSRMISNLRLFRSPTDRWAIERARRVVQLVRS